MNHSWPCVTCPVRDFDICRLLGGVASEESRLQQQPDWQEFQGALANENIVVRDEISEYIYILCQGWAFRFFQVHDGRKQILHILLPGDLFSAVSVFEEKLHFSVRALTDVRVNRFKRTEVKARLAGNPAISTALTQSCIAQSTYMDELLAALGQSPAEGRIAYLFLHIMKRLESRSVIQEQRYPFPLRQQHIAEITGLTSVHVSRVISAFRNRGIIDLSGGVLTVLKLAELQRLGSL